MELWEILIIVFGAISVINFFMYGIDKRKAKKGKWRISEKALLCTSFFGGAIGGFLGMRVFHHKTKHGYFTAVNILGLLWQVFALCYLIKNPSWLF